MGTLYYGDNLEILHRYIKDESVDLVYLDPPFNSAQIRPARAGEESRGSSLWRGAWGRRKSPKRRAVEPAKTQPLFCFQAAIAGVKVAAFFS
jgi:16S rRNA G966 N2-methylase RsmD